MKPRFIISLMSSDLYPSISAFARVAHHASFTKAAAELGISASALSQTVRLLEQRLGVRLLDRTTRRVGLTEIGQRFLADAAPGLSALAKAVEDLDDARDKPAGVLRLNLSRTATDIILLPHLTAFMDAYPDIRLELRCDNNFVDLVAQGLDAGIRLGEFIAQDMVAVRLGGTQRLATFAAPSYLRNRAAPVTPEDLTRHRCLNVRFDGTGAVYQWEFANGGRTFEVDVGATLISNDGDVLMGIARAGGGIGCGFEALARDDFAAGTLVPLLQPWWPSYPGFYLYYSSRRHVPRKLRVFIDFMLRATRDGSIA